MEFLLIVFLTLLNGVFAMSEMALAASRKSRLMAMADNDDKGARASLTLLDNPNQFLSTVQIGITSIGVLNGIVADAAFGNGLAHWLELLGLADKAASLSATALLVTVITFTTIIFGELVPKRIGQLYPEQVARRVARPMLWLAKAASPFVRLLSGATAAMLDLLRIDTNAQRAMTEEEISANLEEGVDAGVIEEHEHQIVQNVFDLDQRSLISMMVPSAEIDWLDGAMTVAAGLQKIGRNGAQQAHFWYPVCRGCLDHVIGKISLGHLLELGPDSAGTLADYVKPAVFVPETISGMELLEQFRSKASRMVLVVDEYGVVQGLLTPYDLLEAITGELPSQLPADAWATEGANGQWQLDGMMPISELKVQLDIDTLPHEGRGRYNTVAGLLLAVSGHLPAVGEKISCADWSFEIASLSGKRIDRVLARRLQPPQPRP